MALDDVPPAVLGRGVGRALVDDLGDPVGERAVDDVRVPRDPADVCGAPVDIGVGLEVEHGVMRVRHLGEVAAGRVEDALRGTGGARCVEDEEGMLAVEGLGDVDIGLTIDDVVPPDIAALVPLDVDAGALDDKHIGDRGRVDDSLVNRGLEGEDGATPVLAVGGDDELGLGVVDAALEGRGGEPAEHDRVRCADAGAGEHGDDCLGNEGHVNRNAVARGDAELDEGIGSLGNLALELRVCDVTTIAELALESNGDLISVAGLDVAIDAVVGDIEPAADEPLGKWCIGPVENVGERGLPVEAAGLLCPEGQAILRRGGVGISGDIGLGRELRARQELAVLTLKAGKGVSAHGSPSGQIGESG